MQPTFKATILAIALAMPSAHAAETTPDDMRHIIQQMHKADPIAAHAVCGAWNALVAVKLEEPARTIIGEEGARHVRHVMASEETEDAMAMIRQLMGDVQLAYNSKQITWPELVMASEACMEI